LASDRRVRLERLFQVAVTNWQKKCTCLS
jgi:hypothetical protein